VEPQCPSCGGIDLTVMGLEEGSLRYKCDNCLGDFLFHDGPDLKLCENLNCSNWVPEGIKFCGECIWRGAPNATRT
jgi:transposase-like protein